MREVQRERDLNWMSWLACQWLTAALARRRPGPDSLEDAVKNLWAGPPRVIGNRRSCSTLLNRVVVLEETKLWLSQGALELLLLRCVRKPPSPYAACLLEVLASPLCDPSAVGRLGSLLRTSCFTCCWLWSFPKIP